MTAKQKVMAFFLVAAGYYLGARVGIALTFQPHTVSVLWPPNSILFAALLIVPPRSWWVVFASAFPVHLLSVAQSPFPLWLGMGLYVTNSCEALLGAATLFVLRAFPFQFHGVVNLSKFLVAAFMGPFLSSFLDAGFVTATGFASGDFWSVFQMRLSSNVLAALTFVPVIVIGCQTARSRSPDYWPLLRVFEAMALSLGLMVVAYFAFLRDKTDVSPGPTLLYAPLPFLIWAAIRFGAGGATLAMLAVSITAIWGAAHGHGPFSGRPPEESASALQIFLISVSVYLMALSIIIEEWRAASKEVRTAQERFRKVLDNQTELVCRYLPDTTLTFVNLACCKAFKKSPEELIGHSFLEFVRSEEPAGLTELIARTLEHKTPQLIDLEIPVPAGKSLWHQWTNNVVFDPASHVTEIQALGRDITERKRVEEIKRGLAHASRLAVVGELTAMIAHEVNQPLGAILNNAEAAELLLEQEDAPIDEIRRILADIRRDDLRTNEAIQRLRNLLRKRELEIKPLDINSTVAEVIQMVQGDAARRRVQICPQLHPSLPNVMGDKVHLQQVLLNLTLNAMDALAETPESDRWIIVKTSLLHKGFIEIAVEDSGRGIPDEHMPHLFDSFYTTKPEGMGLGLSLTRTIVDAHKGRIWAENNQKTGATFRVVLPTSS